MKERGMIFNTEMVQAILDGRKTVTRRPVKIQPRVHHWDSLPNYALKCHKLADNHYRFSHSFKGVNISNQEYDGPVFCCHYGQPGDRIYVRETWERLMMYDENDMPYSPYQYQMFYKADGIPDIRMLDEDGYEDENQSFRWKPSIHMPKKFARIWLEITDVRVERVHDIEQTHDSVFKEGWPFAGINTGIPFKDFGILWDSIYQNWGVNPWVWVIEFKRVDK